MDLESLREEIGYCPENSLIDRRNYVYNYLDNLDDGDREMARGIADDIMREGKPLADTTVIIPVAAHQESTQIVGAIAEYAKQKSDKPFTVILGLNSPIDSYGEQGIKDTEKQVKKAKEAYSSLDVRATDVIYYDEPVIGEVRRDLWNGVALASRDTGNFEKHPEVIGINHDIDLVRLGQRYISLVQTRYRELDERPVIASVSPVYGTKAKHAFSPDHPNASKTVLWSDFVYRQAGAPFEAGIVIPFSFYSKRGGINRQRRTHEIGSLASSSMLRPVILRGTNMETSIRRYLHRMPRDGLAIWSDPDTFTAYDKCREGESVPDIDEEQCQLFVNMELKRHVKYICQGAADRADRKFWSKSSSELADWSSSENALENLQLYTESCVSKAGRLSSFVLDRIFGSAYMCKKIEAMFTPEKVRDFSEEYIAESVKV